MNEPACEPSLKNLNRKRHCGFLNKKYLLKKALWKEVSNFYIKAKKAAKGLELVKFMPHGFKILNALVANYVISRSEIKTFQLLVLNSESYLN